jgi:hypothetical protein
MSNDEYRSATNLRSQFSNISILSPLRKVFSTNNDIKTVKKNMKSFTPKSRFIDYKPLNYR